VPLRLRTVPFATLFFVALAAAGGCNSSSTPAPTPGAGGSTQTNSSGGTGGDSPSEATGGKPLKLLVVDDPSLAATLQREWRTIANEPLEMAELTLAEVEAAERLPAADVILYPTSLLGSLVDKQALVPLPDAFWNGDRIERRQLLEIPRKRLAMWGEKPFAVPLGEPTPVFVYRADIFESLRLSPPGLWSDFQTQAGRLSTREEVGALAPPASDAWYGLLEPLAPGSAATTLLVRAAPYARHRNQYSTLFDLVTFDPLIASPPFVKALEDLVATHGMNPGPVLEMDAAAVRREILAGRAAGGITWSVAARPTTSDAPTTGTAPTDSPAEPPADEAADARRFGVAAAPGAASAYIAGQKRWETRPEDDPAFVPVLGIQGRLGSVMRSSRRPGAASNLLAMLSTADWSVRVLAASPATGPSRTSHLESPDRWIDPRLAGEPARQYAAVVREQQRAPLWLVVPRIPGQAQYLAALDAAVRSAVQGEKTPEEALASASAEWQKITDERGRDRQKAIYRQCLGVDP